MEDNRPSSEEILPSKGLPYDGLLPDGRIKVFSMRAPDEKMFAGIVSRMDLETVIDSIIRRCSSLPKDLSPENLYIGDRLFLFIMIRAASYGAQYGFKATCSDCNASWDNEINLMKDLDISEAPDDHQDPFEIELPSSGDRVTLRLFRGTDERSVIQYVERQNKKVNLKVVGDPGYIYSIALHIVGVKFDAEPANNFSKDNCIVPGTLLANAQSYVENLTAQDSSTIREEIDLRTPGIKLTLSLTCPKCRKEFDLQMPMSSDFFRTKNVGRSHTSGRVISRPKG